MQFHALRRTALFGLCALLVACGGGGDGVTALPGSVSVTSTSSAEVDTAAVFTTNIGGATGGLAFAWDFGDGGTSSAAAPIHTYAAGGEYTVTLTVTNEAGTSRSTSQTLVASRAAMVRGAICTGAASTGWCWQRPRPSGNPTQDMTFIDASVGWAVGYSGQILKTSDGGATWVGQHSGVSNRLTQVRFANASIGWAVGEGAAIVRTTDGGATWTVQASGLTFAGYFADYAIAVIDASRAVLYEPSGITRITVDGGEHWNASVLGAKLVTRDGSLWNAQGATVWKSSDLGQTAPVSLQLGSSAQIVGIDFADDSHGWVFGYDGSTPYPYEQFLWRTQDGGASWSQLAWNLPEPAQAMKFTSAGVGWAQSLGTLYRTTNGGVDWTAIALPAGLPAYALPNPIRAFDDDTLWLPYANGGYLTRDGGASWTLLKIDAVPAYTYLEPRLRLEPVGVMWLTFPTLSYRSVDSGVSWQQVFGRDARDQDGNVLAVWFFDAKKGVAVSAAGTFLETSDSGRTWSRRANASTPNYGASRFQFSSASNGWLLNTSYAGDSVGKTTDGGASWWVPPTPVDFGGLSDFHFVDPQGGWAVGRNGTISHSTDGGQSWARQAAMPYEWNGVRFASDRVGVVVGSSGVIARTADAGASWELRPSGVAQNLKRVTFVDAHTAWAVGAYGTVVKSNDAGLNWTQVTVPSAESLNDIVFVDARHGWIVGDNGTVLATADAGQNWILQPSGTDASLLGAVFVDSRTGWLVGGGGSILATATGGN